MQYVTLGYNLRRCVIGYKSYGILFGDNALLFYNDMLLKCYNMG